ncbi:SDR family oxidoreductase [Caldimonas sp. KR1-144]|uniref:SDR family oxidoreductase n=1 Tax=Caldimonas sp. KR1-144 TaxID=3400911 RepID=UPI003C10377C
MNVLVAGASRGIGFEFVRQYRAAGARVTATARDDAALSRLRELGAEAFVLDVADPASVSQLGWRLDGAALDVVVLNAGVYGPSTQGLEPPSVADFDAVMRSNVLGAMQVVPQLVDALAPGARIAALSSRMGSIGNRTGTSGWLYRASKAALNSVMKDVSTVLAGRALCAVFHPGWVRTDMGGARATLTPEQSVSDLRERIARLTPAEHGGFFDHDGSRIEW